MEKTDNIEIKIGDHPPQVLIVDDEKDMGEFIADVATPMNFSCTVTSSSAEFMAALRPNVALIILDLMMPDMDGIEILRLLKQQNCKSRILLVSGVDKRVLEIAEDLGKSLNLDIIGRLQKPFRKVDLEKILSEVIILPSPSNDVAPVLREQTITITGNMLRLALERDELLVYYQPQIDLMTGHVVGVEALVRWQHPKHGLIMPEGAFIDQTEALGLSDQLGWYVANIALFEIGKFTESNDILLTVSLNVSPYSLHNLKFPDLLVELAKKCGLQPGNITIEITESGLFKELSSALDILTRLRMKQFKLSIDDFGMGYAMIQQIQHIPATELKIDKLFIKDLDTKESARIMVLKIIEMGHALGMKVLGEGVETAEQLAFLRANHCDLAQGYLFCRPLPYVTLLDWLNTSQQFF